MKSLSRNFYDSRNRSNSRIHDFLHNTPLILGQPPFHNYARNQFLHIVAVINISTTAEPHHVQDEINFKNNEEFLDPIILPPEVIVIVFFVDPTPKVTMFWKQHFFGSPPTRPRSSYTSA